MLYVIDASVAVMWYADEEHSDRAELLLDESIKLAAPDLLPVEVANALWKKVRAGDMKLSDARRAVEQISEPPIELFDSAALLETAFDIAHKYDRAVYDCLYLTLAVELGVQLVAADRRFFTAIRNTTLKSHVLWIGNF